MLVFVGLNGILLGVGKLLFGIVSQEIKAMELAQVIDWSRDAIRLALLLSGPPLAVALAIGLLIGIGQTLTQLHEPVVAMVPRLVGVMLLILVILPWLISRWTTFTTQLIVSIPGSL